MRLYRGSVFYMLRGLRMKTYWMKMSLTWLYAKIYKESVIRTHPRRSPVQFQLEIMEDRIAPATFTVTTVQDNGNDQNPTEKSLRAAIVAVDNGNANAIAFAIPNGGNQVIKLAATLPSITKTVTINGSTKNGVGSFFDRFTRTATATRHQIQSQS